MCICIVWHNTSHGMCALFAFTTSTFIFEMEMSLNVTREWNVCRCTRSCLKCEYRTVVRGSLSWLICASVCVWVGEWIVTFVLSTFYCASHLYFVSCTRSDNTLICVFNTTLMFFITRWNVSFAMFTHPSPPDASLLPYIHFLVAHICLHLSISFSLLNFGEGVVDTRTQYNMCTYVNVTTNRCKQ